ncbi:glycosyltransferase [Flavobacterium sp. DSR3-2]|uniref:glycosyltransferase n=1 Tax=Flavobacterium sp. DSR3-2 TaxID=2804634 RepID=UPI003CF33E1C
MKVLHITNSIDKSAGGPSRSVPQTCIELGKLGITIKLITRKSADAVIIKETSHLTVEFMSMRELIMYGSRLSAKDIDLIHLQHIWNPYIQVMAFWAFQKKIPYIITPRGMLEPWIMANNPFKKKIALALYQRKAIQRATHIHATAQMEADNIRSLGFKNPITIIPNGIDLSDVKKTKTAYGCKKMVFLSRIHPKKGIELLLQAWRNSNTKSWTLEIAGNGESSYINKLSDSAKDLKNVSFIGPHYGESKWDFLRSADVMVLPTYSENFGIAVAEALAVGVPVITTQGTPWEDLETNKCGWWIDLSVTNLEIALLKAFQTPAHELEIMGTNGQQLIAAKYDIKAVAKSTIALYHKTLK